MSTQESKKQVVSQEEFTNFLKGLQLQTLRMRSLRVDAEREFAHNEMKNVQHSEEYAFDYAEEGHLRVDARYKLRLVGPRRKKLGSISVVFGWYYQSEQNINEAIFEIFAPTVRFQTWPHLREVILNTAARANWPRLTIPLLIAQKPPE